MVAAAIVGALPAATITASWAATLTLTSTRLGAATVSPYLYPTALTTTNNGTTAGRVGGGDSFAVTFSEQIQASTICPAASNTATSQTLPGLTVQIVDNAASTGNDQMVYQVGSSPCSSVRFGTLDLGSTSYVTGGSVAFSSSSALITQGTSTATVTVTLGTAGTGGSLGTVAAGSAVLYTPDAAISDKTGHTIGTSTVATISATQF